MTSSQVGPPARMLQRWPPRSRSRDAAAAKQRSIRQSHLPHDLSNMQQQRAHPTGPDDARSKKKTGYGGKDEAEMITGSAGLQPPHLASCTLCRPAALSTKHTSPSPLTLDWRNKKVIKLKATYKSDIMEN